MIELPFFFVSCKTSPPFVFLINILNFYKNYG